MYKNSRITNDILYSFFNCNYKAWLKVQGEVRSSKSDFEILLNEQNVCIRSHFINRICSKTDKILTNTENINSCILERRYGFIFNGLITTDIFVLNNFALENVSGVSKFGEYLYVPIITSANETIIKSDRLMLASFGACLEFLQGNKPDFGKIIYGSKFKSTKVNLKPLYFEIENIFLQLVRFQKGEESLNRILNKHCIICEFREICRDKAIEEDHLSLLTGISEKEIHKLNNKGIFTVNQLSYTFRPRRKRKITNKRKRHSYALKALSIRENKIHVYETPLMLTSDTKIFFDMEGLPGIGFCYLIGLVIIHNGKTFEYSFWADTKEDETNIFLKLLELIDQFGNYTLYHYGNYEIKNLKRVGKKLNFTNKKRIEKIIRYCSNLLSIMYSNIYPPTYSNSLKDIGNYIGFKWTDKNSTGIQSIVWRKRWESTGLMKYKNKLIKYNLEDCYALVKVYNLIKVIITNDNMESAEDTEKAMIIHIDNLKKSSPFKFWNKDFALKEFDMINKCSYFDYQREKVHIRKHKLPKKKKAKIPTRAKNPHRINKTIDLYSKNCIECKKYNLDKKEQISRKVIDLKFSDGGVKRWIVRYRAHYYSCKNCKSRFLPTKYKNIKSKYAHNLICWAIFQHIFNNQSVTKIEYNFYEIFKLNVPKTMIHEFKRYFMEYYDYTYTKLKKKILSSEVIYIDETPLKMKYESGYAWVLATSEEVIFFYKPTREGDFLKEYLKEFKGILVSDFFPAYDYLVCIQLLLNS